jgi:hypothetical protein
MKTVTEISDQLSIVAGRIQQKGEMETTHHRNGTETVKV